MCYFHHLNETFSHLKQSIFWPKLMLRICIQGGLAIVYLLLHWENLKTLQKEGSKNHSEKMTSLRSNCTSELNSRIPKIDSVSVEHSLYWPSTKLWTFKSTKWVFRYKLPLGFWESIGWILCLNYFGWNITQLMLTSLQTSTGDPDRRGQGFWKLFLSGREWSWQVQRIHWTIRWVNKNNQMIKNSLIATRIQERII